jgi:hypothetical protein
MVNEEERLIVKQAIANIRPSTHGWWRTNCPICVIAKGSDDKKASLRFRPDNGYYDCLRCGAKGWLTGDYQSYVKEEEETVDDADAEWRKPPEGFMLLGEEPALTAQVTKPARDYLLSRNIGPAEWKKMKVGITFEGKYKNRIIVPVIVHGRWYGWSARIWAKKSEGVLTYRNANGMPRGEVLWNQNALYTKTDDPVVAVEGCFDGLPHVNTIDVVAFLGKPSHEHFWTLLGAVRPIVVALDGDSWTQAKAFSLKLRHKNKISTYLKFPPKVDPGELAPGELARMARESLNE